MDNLMKNYIAAQIEEARAKGLIFVGMTGNIGGSMLELCDYISEVPSSDTLKIQRDI